MSMFKKPPATLKSFSPLRSSDKRRLRDEILTSFPSLHPADSTNEEKTEINNVLTPNGLESSKFTSHIEEPGVIYTTAEGTPLWFRLTHGGVKKDGLIVPSVYMLWKFPDMLPSVVTWGPVIEKLQNGADLMLPGLIVPTTGLPDVEKGELVAIKARGYKYPLAVGTMAFATANVDVRKGRESMKGKAVHILHVHGDTLSTMGGAQEPPVDPNATQAAGNEGYESSGSEDEDDDEVEDGVADDTEVTGDKSPLQKVEAGLEALSVATEEVKGPAEASTSSSGNTAAKEYALTQEETDRHLHNALLHALKFKITEGQAKELLPMNASTLYSAYILPSRERGPGSEADIKKSSWKKLAKWLKTVEKQDIVKCKEIKGELLLISVAWKHPQLVAFTGQKVASPAQPAKAESSSQSHGAASSQQQSLEIQECYLPASGSLLFFEEAKISRENMLTTNDLKTILTTYIKEHDLADRKNPRMVRMDPYLFPAVSKKGENFDTLPRDMLLTKLLDNMQMYHSVSVAGTTPKFQKGALKTVHIILEIRTGRKAVTRISGLEHYMIDVEAFSQELQHLCASSVAVSPLVGASPKLNLKEVMVQGPQLKIVSSQLLARGVPKKYIEVLDKTKK